MAPTWPSANALRVRTLGERAFPSPLGLGKRSAIPGGYTPDAARVLLNVELGLGTEPPEPLAFEKAGPRERIYFNPKETRAAIVTCGGLCPGVNDVIRSAVLQFHYRYGIQEVIGFRYGFAGLNPASGHAPVKLTIDEVRHLHGRGGTWLGTSRGAQDVSVMADTLERSDVQILLAVGGDGTLRGASALSDELARRGAKIAVVGVPKTIDNDVMWTDRTFGFETAVEEARSAIEAAHTEAIAAKGGIGLVKLMGRDSGFIAAAATRASQDVNFCLVPEVPLKVRGEGGLFEELAKRLAARDHAVVVVAEGCTWLLGEREAERDASGNVRYASGALDVGAHLRDDMIAYFKERSIPITLKYIDPSYVIRSVGANTGDRILCDSLARHAVHAAMAGKTDVVIGRWCGLFTHVPIPVATASRKSIYPEGSIWMSVLDATGQPACKP